MKNKEGINYKLVNISLFVFIIYIFYKVNILNKIFDFLIILFLSFTLSYIVYPIYKGLSNKLNKITSIVITYIFLGLLILFIFYLLIPSSKFIKNITDLFSNILKFIYNLNEKYHITIDFYIKNLGNYIINNGMLMIANIFNLMGEIMFIVILSICILFNADYIKNIIRKFKHYELIDNINIKLRSYIMGNFKIILIQLIEYTLIFYIIGHPNFFLLGILNSFNSFLPFFGALFTNIIAVVTASVISPKLLFLTAIISLVFPNVDAYLINPKIYKNTNKLSQTLTISSVILGGVLFGFFGIVFAIPILIIIIEIVNYKKYLKKK